MNTLIYGPNNSGKTDRILFKEITSKIVKNESFLFLDAKEEYYHHYYQSLTEKGYKINIINLKKFKNSNNWNPFYIPYQMYRDNQDQSVDMLRSMGKYLFEDDSVNDKFLVNTCVDLFIGLSLILFEFAKEDAVNLYSIYHLLEYSEDFGEVLEKIKKSKSLWLALDEFLSSTVDIQKKVFTHFKHKLNIYLLYEDLASLLSGTTLSIEDLKSEKVALFIVNRVGNKNINNLVNIFISQLYEWVINNKSRHKFNFVLDNLQSIEKINSLNNMLIQSNISNFDIFVSVTDTDWFKNKYSIDNINVIYNLENSDSVIKVTSNSKRKYNIEKYPRMLLKNSADYPELENPTKYLFNLSNYLKNNY